MGISPLPTEAQARSQKSGKALQRIEESGQRGTFHFVDHYDDAIIRTYAIHCFKQVVKNDMKLR